MRQFLTWLLFSGCSVAFLVLNGCAGQTRLVDDRYESGQVKVAGALEGGKQEGVWQYYYEDGTLKSEGAWLHDYQDGAWTYFYPNGKRKQSGTYASKLRQGTWTYWYDNEQINCSGSYQADRQNGTWLYYRQDGSRFSVGNFVDGIKQGLWQWFDEQGKLKTSGAFYNGQRVGPWLVDGQLVDKGIPADMQAFSEVQGETVRWGLTDKNAVSVFSCVLDAAQVPATEKQTEVKVSTDELILSAADQPALTPVVQIDTMWTKREELKVGKLISNYAHAILGEADEYRAASEKRKMQTQWLGKELPQTRFFQYTGEVIDLAEYVGKKSVTLVVMRGFAGQVCVYCSAQTRALAEQIEMFKDLDNEVIIVYPGAAETIPMFIKAVQSVGGDAEKIKIVLDVNLSLVKNLEIIKDLSKPTSIVVDKTGLVIYGYVGTNMGDRPSAKELLSVVKQVR